MTTPIDPVAHNRAAWDAQVAGGNEWTQPVGHDVIARARAGDWSVVLIGYKPVRRDWLPDDMGGLDLLGLASAGGQQGPVFAATGANVTVFDNSPRQLARDQEVAAREGLVLRTVLGDMRDLSVFADASFDLVFNPVSNLFCPDLAPVWSECFRVLRPGGLLLAGFMNPDVYIFDPVPLDERGELIVRYPLPYSDLADLGIDEHHRRYGPGTPLEYSHTMSEQVGGQLAAGFVITGFDEAPHHVQATSKYLPGYYATRAMKPAR